MGVSKGHFHVSADKGNGIIAGDEMGAPVGRGDGYGHTPLQKEEQAGHVSAVPAEVFPLAVVEK